MNRFFKTALAALAISTFALPALAETGARPERASHGEHRGEKRAKGDKAGKAGRGERGEKGDKAQFPMPAADFQARIAKHREKAHARVEEHIAKKNLPADKAAAVRAKMAAAEAVVNQEVAKVVADGTVTKDEAKQVREVARAQRPGKGHKKGDKKPA
jgi:hypothetical protein